jgi:N-sulfoglucosamine sulfohydrolase
MAALKKQMLDTLKAEGDPRALGNGAVFDTYEYTKSSPKDYSTWLKTQDEIISAEAEKRSRETKAAVKKGKKAPMP